MIYKRCPRCNKRLEAGTTCECSKLRHKEYDKFSRDKDSAKFYSSSAWKRMREYIMNKYDNLDVSCVDQKDRLSRRNCQRF